MIEAVSTSLLTLWQTASPTSWALAGVCVALVTFYMYSMSYRGRWEKYGIPVPPAWPIINHWPAFREGEEAPLENWFRDLGDTYGTYGMFPHDPILITRDLKLLKHILVKDFANFYDRYWVRISWTRMGSSMFFRYGNDWSRPRHVTSPMFTGGKLRIMMTHITKSANNLNKLIRMHSDNNELVPIKLLTGKYASEIIARVGFGMETHAVTKEKSEFANNTENLTRMSTPLQKWTHAISFFFPPFFFMLRRLGLKVDMINEDVDAYFTRILKAEIAKRTDERLRTGKSRIRDMLDMYLEAEVAQDDPKLDVPAAKAMTREEIICNINFLIFAAFETVSSVLQTIMYHLAENQDIQQKIRDEVNEVMGDDEEVTYDHVRKFHYVEQVINEGMRCQPAVSIIMRQSIETRTYDGITIPGGSKIVVPVAFVLKDKKHWGEDVEKFDPDRFSPENCKKRDPMAFMPFGYGPKICVGMRFAYVELKVVLATMLKDFRFEFSERSEPKKGQQVKIIRHEIGFCRPEKPVMAEAIPLKK